MFLRFELAFVDVDDVGQGLESIEGNTDRQDDVQRETIEMEGEKIQEINRALDKEIEVLEEDKSPDANDDRCN